MKLTDEKIEKAEAQFTEWFVKNYPGPDTIIGKPEWHAPRIFSRARAALEAVMPGEPVGCPECQGTGLRDTGGVHPWGEYILVPCDHSAAHPAPEPGELERLRSENERLREANEAAVEIAETIYHNPAGSLWNYGTAPTSKDRAEWKGAKDTALEILQYLDPDRARAALAGEGRDDLTRLKGPPPPKK